MKEVDVIHISNLKYKTSYAVWDSVYGDIHSLIGRECLKRHLYDHIWEKLREPVVNSDLEFYIKTRIEEYDFKI